MERYFKKFRDNIIGLNQTIISPDNREHRIVYADWTASGRNYMPIEKILVNKFMPYVANTHTETSSTGMAMTHAYHKARQVIKKHVNASADDVLITANSGMTGVINKFQRILGFRIHEKYLGAIRFDDTERPIVFVSHMEHHSNQTSWLETIAEVKIIPPDENGLVCVEQFKKTLEPYKHRKHKIAAITSCSNVTGILTNYYDIAEEIHKHNGYCFVDFACSAPYINIDMHPKDRPQAQLDAIYFSPHKFLGGPGTSGVLVFNNKLYDNKIPDNPGGGTVSWTDPWGDHEYVDDIEAREDGGTPAFLQTIKVALCINLKDEMGVDNILKREEEQLDYIWDRIKNIAGLNILADNHKTRLGVISFYIDGLHYNLGVKMLNDRFGIQTRGGCSCAGTYGHYLLNITEDISHSITEQIMHGDCSLKPGWIRMSIHPTMTNEELDYIVEALQSLAENFNEWSKEYELDYTHNLVTHKNQKADNQLKKEMEFLLDTTISDLVNETLPVS